MNLDNKEKKQSEMEKVFEDKKLYFKENVDGTYLSTFNVD